MQRVLFLILVGCGDEGDDTANDTGTLPATDGTGLVGVEGEATVTADGYSGTQDSYLLDSNDNDLCRIHYTLSSAAVRKDCESCEWAFDLEVGEPETLADRYCELLEVPSSLSYGEALEYLGHADALMLDEDGTWSAVTFATWDPDTGEFSYTWEQAYVELE